MNPTNRTEFKDYIMRRLGYPVIEINVSEDQVDDRIDEALSFWHDFHFDGTEREYFKHKLTQTDIDNGYITVPENIIGAIRLFPLQTGSSGDMFSIQYQYMLNNMHLLTSGTLVPYYMTMQHLSLLNEILNGLPLVRYNRHRNRLHLDISKEKLSVDMWIVAECHMIVDPVTFPDVWKDRWFIRYVSALVEQQMGRNLTKMNGVQLLGGVTFNGEQIFERATQEVKDIEQEMRDSATPPMDMIG